MFLYYLIATLSILLYLHGFFPIPARSPPTPSLQNNLTSSIHQRAVLIIIDALRLDFISDDKTPFLSQAQKSNGCFIHLKVETPTVTLPRIKALTTGNVPQFIDIIINLASPTKVEDSFIHQANLKGKKLVFYGDDTWLKMFPNEFVRSEGTTSFFVNDFKEVDDNVTRNVRQEKHNRDWDIMILHYLGLDHIGHVHGPNSPLIAIKLNEMDSVIEDIYNSHNHDTLILVTGDHGMRNGGGHGGSTYSETNVPLVVLNAPCVNDTFPQIDFAANFAVLLNINIPTTSIGQLHHSLLGHLSLPQFLEALKYNTLLLNNKLNLCEENLRTANHLRELFSLNHDENLAKNAMRLFENCAKTISETLLEASVQQNVCSLVTASVTALTVLLKILQNVTGVQRKLPFYMEQMAVLTTLCVQFLSLHPIVNVVCILIPLTLCYRNFCWSMKCAKPSFLTLLSIAHPLTFFSSSFLEEEHQFWYFVTNTFVFLNALSQKSHKWILLFVALRFARTINQVGDKWAASPDLADWLLQEDNSIFLQLLFVVSLIVTFSFNRQFLDGTVFVLIYCYKMLRPQNIAALGQVLWLSIFVKLGLCFWNNTNVVSVWILVIGLLIKPHNMILVPICILASRVFHSTLQGRDLILAHWWLGNVLFFAHGHDNSLASVDISSGYVGLSEYNPLFVVPQVLMHTYAFPVLSHLLLFTNPQIQIRHCFSLFILLRLYVVIVVFAVTFLHRHHLFVWSVFAPKMFVEGSHFGFLFIEVCCYYLKVLIHCFYCYCRKLY